MRRHPSGARRGVRVGPGKLQPRVRAHGGELLEGLAVDVRGRVVELHADMLVRAISRRRAPRRTSTAVRARSPPPTEGCARPWLRTAAAPGAARPARWRSAPCLPTASRCGYAAPAGRPPSSIASPDGCAGCCCAEPVPSPLPRAAASSARSRCSAPPRTPPEPPPAGLASGPRRCAYNSRSRRSASASSVPSTRSFR